MQFVILCGGKATRLGKLSENIPKGLIKIKNKPFMKYLISSLMNYGPTSIHFCLGKYSEQYIQFFDKEKFNIPITFSVEDENNLLGTGGAIKNALKYLNEVFIVQYGDTLLEIDYKNLFFNHLQSSKDMTMTILPVNLTDESPNMICETNKEGKLFCLYDKLKYKYSGNFIDYGTIVFNKKVFEENLPFKFDLTLLQEKLTSLSRASFFLASKKYIEIGTIKSLNEAERSLRNV